MTCIMLCTTPFTLLQPWAPEKRCGYGVSSLVMKVSDFKLTRGDPIEMIIWVLLELGNRRQSGIMLAISSSCVLTGQEKYGHIISSRRPYGIKRRRHQG